jgi:hypothetical protein
MRNLVLLIPFLAAIAAVATKDRVLAVLILFCYLTVEGMLKLMSSYHPLVHIGTDIVLWSMVAAWAAIALASGRKRVPRVPFLTLLILHVTWVLLLVFSPYTASLFVGIASLKIHLSMIPLYFIGFMLAADASAPGRFLRVLTLFWTATFVFTLLQYAGGPDSMLDLGEAYRLRASYFHEWRPFGTTSLPGGQSVIALLALPFAMYLAFRAEHAWRDWRIIATIVASLAVFFVSGVRQVFLGSLVIVVTMTGLQVMRGRGRAVTGLVAVGALGVATFIAVQQFIVPAARRSIQEATGVPEIWRDRDVVDRFGSLLDPETYARVRAGGVRLIWNRITEAPLGVGLGRTGSAASALQDQLERDAFNKMLQDRFGFQDNFFAAMLVETGIPGTLMLTTILVGLGVLSVRLARRAATREDSAFGALVAGYILALLVMSWGSQPLLGNPTLAFFWFLGGMAMGRLDAVTLDANAEFAAADGTGYITRR